jgi:anti-sigma factor (TIGR02949 family)
MNHGHQDGWDCDGVIARLWDYLDGELSDEGLAAFEAHLAACGDCSGHVGFERSVLAAIRQGRRDALDATALATRVREALVGAGFVDAQ